MELPTDVRNTGRFVARLLKHLLRTWGVKCVALEESAEIRQLQKIVESLADRVAAQSELLAKRASAGPSQEAALSPAMFYEVGPSCPLIPNAWSAEAVNFAGDGEIYVAIFVGPRGRERAEEYAAWKNKQEE